MVGSLLDSQPLYMSGVDDTEKAAGSCYGAAGIYATFLAVSLAYWYYDNKQQAREADSCLRSTEQFHTRL